MVHKTPIRLVAIDEEPPDDDLSLVEEVAPEENTVPTLVEAPDPEQEAAPTQSTPENEAITRRVPAIEEAPVQAPVAQVPEWPKAKRTWRRFVPLAVALVPLVGLTVAWLLSTASSTAPKTATSPTPERAPAPSLPAPTPAPSPQPALAARTPPAPETIRLKITVEPVQAELGLDGNVLAGNRLNLEVPRDRGIHVVSASAPGYYPFNQQVSFSDDIVLQINLRRAHGAAARQVSRPRASATTRAQAASKSLPPAAPQVEPKAPTSVKSHAAPSAPRMEPGMDMDTLGSRHGAKSIDERNPYQP